MDLKDVFLFKSRQRRQREEAEYQERIFHLGPGHREAVLQRLKSLIREEKTEAELIYLYTCVKDIYTASRPGEREDALGEWYEATYSGGGSSGERSGELGVAARRAIPGRSTLKITVIKQKSRKVEADPTTAVPCGIFLCSGPTGFFRVPVARPPASGPYTGNKQD